MAKIEPLKLKDYEECISIVKPTLYYGKMTPVERINYLRMMLPQKLETINQVVWSRYPPEQLMKIDEAIQDLTVLSESTVNANLQRKINLAKELLDSLVFIFKNYEDIVALSTLMYYETDNLLNTENSELAELKKIVAHQEYEYGKLKDKILEYQTLIPEIADSLKLLNMLKEGTEEIIQRAEQNRVNLGIEEPPAEQDESEMQGFEKRSSKNKKVKNSNQD